MAVPARSVSYKAVLESCDLDLKAGQIAAVVERIAKLKIVSVPREFRLRLAVVCRRAGLCDTGLRLLTRLVRGDRPSATLEEKVEYAALLAQNGSVAEALEILNETDGNGLANSFLVRGFCNVRIWNYAEALNDFERFLATNPEQTPYLEVVARVNVAAALVATAQWERALPVVTTCLEAAKSSNSLRLIGNSLELRAQIQLAIGKLDLCRRDLQEALPIFSDGSADQLYVRKWLSILDATETRSTLTLERLKEAALKLEHWETLRESDLYINKINFTQEGFDHLYFGSPFPAYRERIRREISAEPSAVYLLGGQKTQVLDISSGEMHGGHEINAGKKIHQVLSALCSDFYAPIKLGQLFAQIYPGEYFDIFSSPARVHSSIKRCRTWFAEAAVPASIDSIGGGYALKLDGDFAIRIELQRKNVAPENVVWTKLQALIPPGKTFSAQTACRRLNMSKTTFIRLINLLVRDGKIKVVNSGRATKYLIKQP